MNEIIYSVTMDEETLLPTWTLYTVYVATTRSLILTEVMLFGFCSCFSCFVVTFEADFNFKGSSVIIIKQLIKHAKK